MLTKDYYNDFFDFGQQKINFNFYELALPDDDPVYTLKKVMEDLDFSGLLACYTDKGRTGYNPIMLYAVVTYANMRGVRAVDRIVDLCGRDLAFIMLTKGRHPKRDTFYDFKGEKLKGEVLDELNHQFMRRLEKEGLVTLKQLYVDGTKIEANANRYTFVWRGTLNYHLAGLLDTIDALYERYNTLLSEHGYGAKYNLGNARMFIIEGMDKVRNVIEENRKRKLTKHKKISNNTVIEIDNCSPLEILKLQQNLLWVAAENYFIVHGYVSNDRTDYNTLIPVLEKHQEAFGNMPEEVTADSGYCSEKNLLYLKENTITSYIKLQDHEQRKARIRRNACINMMPKKMRRKTRS
jgi:transposase